MGAEQILCVADAFGGEDSLPPLLLYRYSPTKNGDNAVEMLKGSLPGLYLMVDGFQGYDKLKNVKRCACYAHIRRYFLDAMGCGKNLSNPAVQGATFPFFGRWGAGRKSIMHK